MKKAWLKDWPWETVVVINATLCQEKKALHQPTSDGYATAKSAWDSARDSEMTLREVLDLCRRCHKLAPFCFYNGNTFAAIGRTMIQEILQQLPADKAHGFRSVAGHYIAGTIGAGELTAALADLKL